MQSKKNVALIEYFLNYIFFRAVNEDHLKALKNKTHHFNIPGYLEFDINWGESYLSLERYSHKVPDLVITMPMASLFTFITSQNIQTSMQAGLKIEGDTIQGSHLQQLLTLNVDKIESFLSQIFGGAVTSKLLDWIKKAQEEKDLKIEQGLFMLSDYLQHESEWIPSTYELEAFNQAVDVLRDDVARLECKIKNWYNVKGT